MQVHDVATQVAKVCAHLADAAKCAASPTSEGGTTQCVLAMLKQSAGMSAAQKWFPALLQVNGN
jgi:hypothetical protein